jgi:spore germination protein YaaH
MAKSFTNNKLLTKLATTTKTTLMTINRRRRKWSWHHTKWFWGFSTLLLGSLALFASWWWTKVPLLSPLSDTPSSWFLATAPPAETPSKVVYGYLPYWNLNKVELQPELTHLAYFGVTISSSGSILLRNEDNTTEPGYARLQSERWLDLANQASQQGAQIELVLTQFNNDDIVALLTQDSAQDRLLASLDSILLAYPVSGISLDLEYTGQVTPQLRQSMTKLVKVIRTHLNQKYDGVQLSMAMYSGAARGGIWDVEELAPELDYVIVMAYDFHRRSSILAGPVAPLFGGQDLWHSDISQHLQSFVKLVEPQKILLGVPFYGYEWQTTNQTAQAHTFPDTGATASYERVQNLLARKHELGVTEHWNETALSPYLSYQEDGLNYLIYYENSRSISYKLDYVNQLNLGGIAIWALGFEGDSRELWDVINQKL